MEVIPGVQIRDHLTIIVFWIMMPCSLVDRINRIYTILQSDTTFVTQIQLKDNYKIITATCFGFLMTPSSGCHSQRFVYTICNVSENTRYLHGQCNAGVLISP